MNDKASNLELCFVLSENVILSGGVSFREQFFAYLVEHLHENTNWRARLTYFRTNSGNSIPICRIRRENTRLVLDLHNLASADFLWYFMLSIQQAGLCNDLSSLFLGEAPGKKLDSKLQTSSELQKLVSSVKRFVQEKYPGVEFITRESAEAIDFDNRDLEYP